MTPPSTSSRGSGRKLGETLVESGALSTEVLQRYLRRQSRLSAFVLAGLALSAGVTGPAAAGDAASLRINATVLSRAVIDRQRLPQEVLLSAQDIARGYVDVEEPVEIAIRSNVPAGVKLGFTLNSEQLAAVDVREGSLFLPQEGPGLRARSVSLRLRLRLAPEAVPGRIAAPLTVFLVPG